MSLLAIYNGRRAITESLIQILLRTRGEEIFFAENGQQEALLLVKFDLE